DDAAPPGDEQQRALLAEKLRDKPNDLTAPAQQSSSALTHSDRQRASDDLGTGLLPLLELVRHLTFLLVAKDVDERRKILMEFLEAWRSTRSGPYKDVYRRS